MTIPGTFLSVILIPEGPMFRLDMALITLDCSVMLLSVS